MTGAIPSPAKDSKLRASWGASVADAVNRHEGELSRLRDPAWVNRRERREMSLAPWTVAWRENAGAGAWCIYLPADACCSLPGATAHLEEFGQGSGWYRIAGASSYASPSASVTFHVFGHVKERVVVGSGYLHTPVLFASAQSGTLAQGNAFAGDVWCPLLATCSVEVTTADGATTYARAVTQHLAGPATHLAPQPRRDLDLEWTVPAVGQSGAGTFTPRFVAQADEIAPLCGKHFGDGVVAYVVALPASGSATVYYVIDCSGQVTAPVPSVSDASPAGTTNLEAKIVVPVYSLSDGCVAGDYRSRIAERVFYP